jgi:hypothetical protein
MIGVLACVHCKTKENYRGLFTSKAGDNGGGWGRVKSIGDCPICNYPYAVLFQHYDINEKGISQYIDGYIKDHLDLFIKYIEERDK